MKILVGMAAICLGLLHAHSQDIAPPIDNSPLEPPDPIAIVRSVDATNLFDRATQFLKTNAFKVIKRDDRGFFVEMRKGEITAPQYDRILLWLARDVADPATIKVNLRFGRYIKLFGGEHKYGRIKMDNDKEDNATAAWKPALIEVLTTQ